jgi:AhpD family alkylhydroperoxidase
MTQQWLAPLSDEAMSEEQRSVVERACLKFGLSEPAPRWVRVMAQSPALLKDMYMNAERAFFKDGALAPATRLQIAAAVASHRGAGELAEYFSAQAQARGVTQAQLMETLGIAQTSTSYNIYYRFRSLVDGDAFDGFNPGLRASLFVNPSQGKAHAELVNIVFSSINGCKSCVNGHVADALKAGVTREQIDEALRASAVAYAMASFVLGA